MSHLVSPARGASPCCGALLCSPGEEEVSASDQQTLSAQADTTTAKVAVNADENNRQWKRDLRGLEVWIKTKSKTYNNAEEVRKVGSSSLAAGPSLEKVRQTLTPNNKTESQLYTF